MTQQAITDAARVQFALEAKDIARDLLSRDIGPDDIDEPLLTAWFLTAMEKGAAMLAAQPTADVGGLVERLRRTAAMGRGSGSNGASRTLAAGLDEAADMLEAFAGQPGQTP